MNFDSSKCENVLQLGGIRTGTYDFPNPLGGQSCRIAHINTGSGLRFVIALDRGGDIVEASFNDLNLAYLTPNDYVPPNPAYQHGVEWLRSWSGGLLTTCGPGLMGEPRVEHGREVPLHGRHSNTPASIVEVRNPDPAHGESEIRLRLITRDSCMFGPVLEVRRTLRCWLGQAVIELEDEVLNLADEPQPHGMLYHINFGYPLLDEGARLIFAGRAAGYCLYENYSATELEACKIIPPPSENFRGANEGVLIVETPPAPDGWRRAGLVNQARNVAVEVAFAAETLPRLATWQHFGPRGSYVTALEPFHGSLFGLTNDNHPAADPWLAPGEACTYRLKISIRCGQEPLQQLIRYDGRLTA